VTRGWVLRVAGSGIILAVIFWILPMDAVVEGFSKIDLVLFLGTFVLFVFGHVIAAAKWWLLLDRRFVFFKAVRAHFAGLAANLCLPGVAGGDVVRAALVMRRSEEKTAIAAGSLADRMIDMLALAIVSAIGLLMLQSGGGWEGVVLPIVGLFAVALIGAFYIMPLLVPVVYGKIPKLPMKGLAHKIATAFGALGKRPVTLLLALTASVAVQAGFVLLTVRIANAVGVDVAIGAWFVAWPLAKVLAILPISLGGLGLREGILAGLLVQFGAVAAPVVATGLVWQAVLFAAGLMGALAWWLTADDKSSNNEFSERVRS